MKSVGDRVMRVLKKITKRVASVRHISESFNERGHRRGVVACHVYFYRAYIVTTFITAHVIMIFSCRVK